MSDQWVFPLCPEPPAFVVDWDALLERYGWLTTLAGCPQDPTYHAEGDVLTHTRMVAESLVEDEVWRELDPSTRSIVFAAALLHDIAKPMTTERQDGRITSPRHASKGARVAQNLLYQGWSSGNLPVPTDARQRIVLLVRYHGLPLWLLDSSDMQRAVITSGAAVRNDLIALLARADARGRICDGQTDLLERIDLFREFCQENRCWSAPYPFASDHSRFEYFRTALRSPSYEAYDGTRCEAVLMSGLPGAGKDTWIASNLPQWSVISLDALRIEMGIEPKEPQGAVVQRAREMARDYLRRSQNFIWNATNTTRQMRAGLINLFASYQARIRIVYVETTWTELLRRNQSREHPVPIDIIRKLADQLDVPDQTEAHQVDWFRMDMPH